MNLVAFEVVFPCHLTVARSYNVTELILADFVVVLVLFFVPRTYNFGMLYLLYL